MYDITFKDDVFTVTKDGEIDKSFNNENEANDYIQRIQGRQGNEEAKYSTYQLEGGENYQEVLLTMPNKQTLPDGYEVKPFTATAGMDAGKSGFRVYDKNGRPVSDTNTSKVEAIKAALTVLEVDGKVPKEFSSNHWNESNILAHIRLNERTLPNGENVLFLEEVQSDWAQEGKKKGFSNKIKQPKTYSDLEVGDDIKGWGKIQSVEAINDEIHYDIGGVKITKDDFDFSKVRERANEFKTPNMPYKKTDQWVGLAIRRVLKMAADKGLDRIAWVTGEQSADRYDLSKQVSEIRYFKTKEGLYELTVNDNNYTQIITAKKYSENELENVVGKEMALKIINNEGEVNEFGAGVLSGLDLKVGGEGMKTFYNSILPKVAKAEAKRFDKNAKIEVIDFDKSTANLKRIYELQAEKEVTTDIGRFKELQAEIEKLNTEAKQFVGEGKIKNQLSIAITPKMKEELEGPVGVTRQQKSLDEVIKEGRAIHFKDALIRDFLVRVKGYGAKEVDKLLEVAVDLFDILPNSFKNIEGGVVVGAKLFDRVNKYKIALNKKNDKNTRLTEAELNTKVNKFAKEQRKTYKTTKQITEEVKAFKEKLVAKNSKKKTPLNSKEINEKVKTFKDGIVAERNDKRDLSIEKVALYEAKETKSNNKKAPLLSNQEIVDKTIEFLETQPEYINESDTYTVGSEKKGTKQTKKRKGFSVSQASMLSDLQKSVGIRPTQDMASKIRMARVMLSNKKRAGNDLNAIKRELRNFIRKSLPIALYSKPEVISMVNKVTLANKDNIDNIYNEVLELAVKKNVEALSKSIDKILSGKFSEVVSGRLKGKKISLEIKERIDFIKNRLFDGKFDAEKVLLANEKILEEYSELLKEPLPSAETQSKMVDLQLVMEYNNSLLMENTDVVKVESLDLINTSLNEMIEFGRTALREELAEATAEYRRQMEGFYGDVVGKPIDMNSDDAQEQLNKAKRIRGNDAQRKKVSGKIKYALNSIEDFITNKVFTSAEALDGLMDKISLLPGEMFGGVTQEMVTERVDASSRKFKQRKMVVEMILQAKLKEIYGKNWSKESRRARNTKETGVFINKQEDNTELILSQNQMYYLYNQFKDPANLKAFAKMYAIEFIEKNDTPIDKKKKAKINEANAKRVMKEMELQLTPEIKEFADWQVEVLFPSLYENYNDVYKKIYRTNMPWNEHYAGRIYRDGVEAEPLDLLGQGGLYNTSVGASSTKARINNNLKIKEMDGTDALATYLNDMEYFAAYAETVRDINKLFTNDYISSAIISIHGKTTMNLINDSIKKIAARGHNNNFADSVVNGMNSVFAISRLALSPVIFIKQLTSIITYANDIGFANWIAYGAKNLPQIVKTWKEIRDNSVYMQDRAYNSILKNIESYSESSMKEFIPNPAKEWLVNFMMYQVKSGDKIAIMLGGMPNYSYYKSQFKKNNPKATEQEAIDYAIVKFERDTKRTQQSGDQQDKDVLQTGNPIVRAFNMFLTTPKQYLRKEIQAVRSLSRKLKQFDRKAGKGTLTENIRTLMMFHVVMPMIFQYVSAGLPGLLAPWDDEDEGDLIRAAVIGNLNALFVAGQIISTLGDYFTHKPWVGKTSKSLGILNIVSSLAYKADIARKTKDPVKRAKRWESFYLEAVTVTTIPAPTIARWIENLSEVGSDDDLAKDLLRLVNYSKYVIDGADNRKSKSSKVKSIYQQNEEYRKKQKKVAKEKESAKNRIPMYARDKDDHKKSKKSRKEKKAEKDRIPMYAR